MNYATVDDLRLYLKQVVGSSERDAELTLMLDRATSIIDTVLGFSFNTYPVASVQTITPDGTPFLLLPPLSVPTLTTVVDYYGTTLLDYTAYPVRRRTYLARGTGWPTLPTQITAAWGYGPPPASVTEVCLELAVNLWRSKDKGLFTDVIGVDTGGGAIVGYMGALTNQQKMILAAVGNDFAATGF